MAWPEVATQEFPFPTDLAAAVEQLRYLEGWVFELTIEARGQGCSGLTLNVFPDKPDAYNPTRHVRTRFLYPVPAAAFNRESWEEWLWARIEDTENHERAEWFKFVTVCPHGDETCPCQDGDPCHYEGKDPMPCPRTGQVGCDCVREYRRPFKPAHPDGWDPSVVRTVVSETVVNTPNAGRLVRFPCRGCGHLHSGRMGEHFVIEYDAGCGEEACEHR